MESNEIKKIIPYDDLWDNLNSLESRLLQVSSSENEYLSSISQYLIKAGGKRFRPIISLLSGKFGDEKSNIKKIIDAGVCLLYTSDAADE